MISSKPCLTSTRWISSSRDRTRGFIECDRLLGASLPGSAIQERQPRFESRHIIAQLVDVGDEFIGFGAGRQVATFLLKIFGDILSQRLDGASTEAQRRARSVADLVSRDIANDARQLFLEVGLRLL